MQLTQFSDYAMRTVLYLGCRPEKLVSVDEISRAYGISRHHLVRVVQSLTELGVVTSQRGRGGGMRLAKAPAEINVGWLIRQTEPHFNLVECLDFETNTCPIAPACGLKGAIQRASRRFWRSSTSLRSTSSSSERPTCFRCWTPTASAASPSKSISPNRKLLD